ncbi:YciI-like protein [Geomonas agri]|uniref:YciI-like protein n=1 Tax=Geomonas agri TaxID=2873702 RepID=UPI001CD672AC|nr:YciI-like protein [Geomonas agri]
MHYLLLYEVAPDYLERRGEFRGAHLALAWEAAQRGELILGGALTDPADGAVLLFKAESPEVPEAFAKADPYVLNGLVAKWTVRGWYTVVGDQAHAPVRP